MIPNLLACVRCLHEVDSRGDETVWVEIAGAKVQENRRVCARCDFHLLSITRGVKL